MKRMLAVLSVGFLAAASSFADAVITVIHGIPGLPAPVTVTANGGELGSFDFNEQLGPLEVPAASYDIEVLLNGVPVPELSATIDLEDGVNYTAVAHLSETGAVTLSLFENNLANLGRHDARLTVRHTAQAPAVDVQVNRVLKWHRRSWAYPFVKALDLANTDTNGAEQFGSVDFRAGAVSAKLLAAGTDGVAASSPVLKLRRGNAYFVYAIGQLGGEFQLYVQAVDAK